MHLITYRNSTTQTKLGFKSSRNFVQRVSFSIPNRNLHLSDACLGFRSFVAVKHQQRDLHPTDNLAASSCSLSLFLTDYLAGGSSSSLDSPTSAVSKAVTAAMESRFLNTYSSPTECSFQQSTTDKVAFRKHPNQQHFSETPSESILYWQSMVSAIQRERCDSPSVEVISAMEVTR
jgi:hypothetical protein